MPLFLGRKIAAELYASQVRPHAHEVTVYHTCGGDGAAWTNWNWSKVTSVAQFCSSQDGFFWGLMCQAHSSGVRVLNWNFGTDAIDACFDANTTTGLDVQNSTAVAIYTNNTVNLTQSMGFDGLLCNSGAGANSGGLWGPTGRLASPCRPLSTHIFVLGKETLLGFLYPRQRYQPASLAIFTHFPLHLHAIPWKFPPWLTGREFSPQVRRGGCGHRRRRTPSASRGSRTRRRPAHLHRHGAQHTAHNM